MNLRVLLSFRGQSDFRLQARMGRIINEAGHKVGFLNLGGSVSGLAVRNEAALSNASVVFVTNFSSTTRLATAAGKPLVNHDEYRIGLTNFDSAGFVSVQAFAEFRRVMTDVVSSVGTYGRLNQLQLAEAREWGIMDGRCTERILDLAGQLSVQ